MNQTDHSTLPRLYLLVLTFWTGVLTLAIEIFAFRSMALILTSSILVTSVVIALVIIALSFGYYLSIGITQQRRNATIIRSLLIVTFSLPVMALIAPVVTGILGPFVYNQDHMISMALGALVSILLLTLPLPLFIGFISPLLFSLLRQHYQSDQETAARSFIASGFGSLVGSVVPNLVLIPFIGLVHSYILLAVLTLVLMFRFLGRLKLLICLILLGLVAVAASFISEQAKYRDYLTIRETPYQTIHVWKHPKTEVVTMSYNAQIGSQSYLDKKLTYSRRSFFDNTLLFMLKDYPSPKDILILGSAGSTISTLANRYLSDQIEFSFTNVDIDPAVHDLAVEWFEAGYPNVRFVAEDARLFVRSDNKKYDLVIVDAYTNELFVPAMLYTSEFFQLVSQRMKNDAMMIMNVNAKDEKSPIIQAGLGALGTVFEHVYVTVGLNEGVSFAPILMSASFEPIDFHQLAANNRIKQLKRELDKMPALTRKVDTSGLPYLEDDSAMVEYLSIATLFH